MFSTCRFAPITNILVANRDDEKNKTVGKDHFSNGVYL
jgi:hypothetical protein